MSDIPMKSWKGWDREDLIAMLRREIYVRGNQKILADRIGISASWLSDILTGHRAPAGKVLTYLGLERVALKVYVPKDSAREAR